MAATTVTFQLYTFTFPGRSDTGTDPGQGFNRASGDLCQLCRDEDWHWCRGERSSRQTWHHGDLSISSLMFPSSVKSEQLVQVSHSSGAVRSLPRAAAATSSLGATLSPPLRGGRSPGRGGERGGSLHLAVNIIYLLTIARNICNLTIFRLVVVEALFHPPARPLYLVLDIVAVSQGDSGHQGRLPSFQSHDADDEEFDLLEICQRKSGSLSWSFCDNFYG